MLFTRYHPNVQTIIEGYHPQPEGEKEIVLTEWFKEIAHGKKRSQIICEATIDGEPGQIPIDENTNPDPIIELSQNTFLIINEEETGYTLVQVPVMEGIGSFIMSGLRWIKDLFVRAFGWLRGKLSGIFGRNLTSEETKNIQQQYKESPDEVTEQVYKYRLQEGDNHIAAQNKARSFKKSVEQSNRVESTAKGAAQEYRDAQEQNRQPSEDAQKVATAAERVASAVDGAEKKDEDHQEVLDKAVEQMANSAAMHDLGEPRALDDEVEEPEEEQPEGQDLEQKRASGKKAIRQERTKERRGPQQIDIAKGQKYNVTIEGNRQVGQTPDGKPQYKSVTANLNPSGTGIAAMIQSYLGGGTIAAGGDIGHITPVKMTIVDPNTNRTIQILTPRSRVQGQDERMYTDEGPVGQRGNIPTQEPEAMTDRQKRIRELQAQQRQAQQQQG